MSRMWVFRGAAQAASFEPTPATGAARPESTALPAGRVRRGPRPFGLRGLRFRAFKLLVSAPLTDACVSPTALKRRRGTHFCAFWLFFEAVVLQ